MGEPDFRLDTRFAARFARYVQVGAPEACWPWLGRGGRQKGGHSQVSYKCVSYGAHRVAWILANGPIPNGLWVLHRCDNGACMNPAHYFLGTQADNMADMDAKGRRVSVGMPGETHPRARLTEADVLDIRRIVKAEPPGTRRSPGGATKAAEKYGITLGAACNIANRRTWKHLK